MGVRRPRSQTKRCAHCRRRRRRKFIEWHPGIYEWQCSNFSGCDAAIAVNDALIRRALKGRTKP